jgi:hypothetical protein
VLPPWESGGFGSLDPEPRRHGLPRHQRCSQGATSSQHWSSGAFGPVPPQHDPPQQPRRIRRRNRAEDGQRDRDSRPRGNTPPKTTLLNGYGVDTVRWADNVRRTGSSCCPGEFQRGLTRRAPDWGEHLRRRSQAWPGTPTAPFIYTRSGSIRQLLTRARLAAPSSAQAGSPSDG